MMAARASSLVRSSSWVLPSASSSLTFAARISKEIPSFELHFKTDSHITCEGYFVKHHGYGDYTTYTCQDVYDGTVEDFDIHRYNHYCTVFTSKELAQQICDKINKENNVPDNLED